MDLLRELSLIDYLLSCAVAAAVIAGALFAARHGVSGCGRACTGRCTGCRFKKQNRGRGA